MGLGMALSYFYSLLDPRDATVVKNKKELIQENLHSNEFYDSHFVHDQKSKRETHYLLSK